MSALDDAITAELTHAAGSGADPLTDSLYGQLAPTQPALRAGWEDEPIVVPVPWRLGAVALVLTVLISSLLMGCGGGDDEDDTKAPNPPDCKAQPELCQ